MGDLVMSGGWIPSEGPCRGLRKRSEILLPDRRGVDGSLHDCGVSIIRNNVGAQDWSELSRDVTGVSVLFGTVSSLVINRGKMTYSTSLKYKMGLGIKSLGLIKPTTGRYTGQKRKYGSHKPRVMS
jgi:hypothetical protein